METGIWYPRGLKKNKSQTQNVALFYHLIWSFESSVNFQDHKQIVTTEINKQIRVSFKWLFDPKVNDQY